MSTNTQAIAINSLQPIAKRLRDRQEQIESTKAKTINELGELIGLIAEQGQDILLAKTKLGRTLKWSEWLTAHVPGLPEQMAARYERVSTEMITDPRQALFAFFPSEHRSAAPKRIAPAAWESFAGIVRKAETVCRTQPLNTWPVEQIQQTRAKLEPIVKALWPDKF